MYWRTKGLDPIWPYGQRYSDFNDEGILGKSMSGGNLPTADGRYSLSLQDKKAWIPTHPTEQSLLLPPVNMEVKTWKCSSYLSNTASFHVHDHGRKIQIKKHLTTPTIPWPDTRFLQKDLKETNNNINHVIPKNQRYPQKNVILKVKSLSKHHCLDLLHLAIFVYFEMFLGWRAGLLDVPLSIRCKGMKWSYPSSAVSSPEPNTPPAPPILNQPHFNENESSQNSGRENHPPPRKKQEEPETLKK